MFLFLLFLFNFFGIIIMILGDCMKNMKKNDKMLLIVFISIFVFVACIGISYAYYTAVIDRGEESASVVSRAGNLEITYTDGSKQIIGSNIFPGWSDSKTFTVKNTGSNVSAYSIRVTNIVNNFSIVNSISLSLTSTDGGKSLSKKPLPSSDSYLVRNVEIGVGKMHTYTVTTYYGNLKTDQSEDRGKSFSYTIEIDQAVEEEVMFADNTIAGKIVGGPNLTLVKESPTTTPGSQAAKTAEGIIKGQDDLGTTYYYRGTATNNYVMFAGMCWRIVRVMGDGNVKITLENSSGNCSSVTSSSAFYGGETTYYTGDIEDPLFKLTDAYATLTDFYEKKISTANQKFIVDSIWCQDFTYGADSRLINKTPSFRCPDSSSGDVNDYRNSMLGGNIENGNKTLPYSIGLLTSDEIVFSGATFNGLLDKMYLYDSSYGQTWTTMSPATAVSRGAFNMLYLWPEGAFDDITYLCYESRFYIRPTIVIDGRSSFTGTGTVSNPYVIG